MVIVGKRFNLCCLFSSIFEGFSCFFNLILQMNSIFIVLGTAVIISVIIQWLIVINIEDLLNYLLLFIYFWHNKKCFLVLKEKFEILDFPYYSLMFEYCPSQKFCVFVSATLCFSSKISFIKSAFIESSCVVTSSIRFR